MKLQELLLASLVGQGMCHYDANSVESNVCGVRRSVLG
jgi:hypothetical protein